MNILKWFKKKPPEVPPSVAIREALEVCLLGLGPPLTHAEFESLYCKILDEEIGGGRNAGQIINDFLDNR